MKQGKKYEWGSSVCTLYTNLLITSSAAFILIIELRLTYFKAILFLEFCCKLDTSLDLINPEKHDIPVAETFVAFRL
jgi:hypothetical protein